MRYIRTENWTHVYMNLFTRNSPYYHLLKYLLFLSKHPVYITPIKKNYRFTPYKDNFYIDWKSRDFF